MAIAPDSAHGLRTNIRKESIIGTVTVEIIEINGATEEIRARYREAVRGF
jgi:hypothetical protein